MDLTKRISSSLPKYTQGTEEYPRFSENGIDLTLIRWMLSLTPTERMQVLRQNLNAIERLHNATTRR